MGENDCEGENGETNDDLGPDAEVEEGKDGRGGPVDDAMEVGVIIWEN